MFDYEKLKNAVRDILVAVGENPDRDGLVDTPDRVARMYKELFAGADKNPKDCLKFFKEAISEQEMVVLKNIEFYSMCEHHLMPFYGKVHVWYFPDSQKVVGVSKIARVVDTFSKRLQIQERLTKEIADFIEQEISPKGVAVVAEAKHMCMTARGVNKPGSQMVTTSFKGEFRYDINLKNQVLAMCNFS